MILGYRDERTQRFAAGEHVKEFSGFARQAEVRLDRLEAATALSDLGALPGNRLEALKGERAGQYSIRINDQWRICSNGRRGRPVRSKSRSSTITEGRTMARTPIHPGEHLIEEMRELGMSAAELARRIDVPVNRVTAIVNGQRGISADTALRLGHWFGTSPAFWMNLQQLYELRLAEVKAGEEIAQLPRLVDVRSSQGAAISG